MVTKDSFTHHKVSEKEKEEIRYQSKKILNEFASKLEELKLKDKKYKLTKEHFSSPNKDTKSGLRNEGEPWTSLQDFIDLTLLNAPLVEANLIIAEKGGWK